MSTLVPLSPIASPVKTELHDKRDAVNAALDDDLPMARRLRRRTAQLPSPQKSSAKSRVERTIRTVRKRLDFNDDKTTLPSPQASPVKSTDSTPSPLVRKRLDFNNEENVLPSPQKEDEAHLPAKGLSAFSRAKALLQRSAIATTDSRGCLGSRDEQFTAVATFLDEAASKQESNSLYITGPPGTGKTAQVEALLRARTNMPTSPTTQIEGLTNTQTYTLPEELKSQPHNVNIASVNCITLKDPAHVFHRIHSCLSTTAILETGQTRMARGRRANAQGVHTMQAMQRFLEMYASHTQFIVVLDEMDKLVRDSVSDTHATRIIFELFLLARMPKLNFVLVGIANSLDLKDKFLSRLNLRQDLLPQTVVFNPYSAEEMATIVLQKMSEIPTQVFNPVSIRFAAKKCAGYTGDLRRLLDVLRHSIEIVELEQRLLKRRGNVDSENSKPVIVGMQHIARVFQTITNAASTRSRISKLNIQQRVLLCCLVQREKTDVFGSSCTLDEAFTYYVKRLSSSDVFKPLNRNEFTEICNTLETCGLVTLTMGRTTGKTKQLVKMVKTTVDENEFNNEISKTDILKNLLQL
ncbi:AAA family ATPase [Maudiozyma humilis]|uniref:Cell division control protein n=1 Tax=Maudiozyma humilis TaxID=51915 RepID=A0AAV5RUS9_MAUHU|nr:AAA family ATPase [Kazachstania humilis]